MDPRTQKWYGIVAAAVVIIGAVGWYFAAHNKAVAPTNDMGSMNATSTSGTGTGTTTLNGVGVVGIADESNIPKPNLDRPYKPLATLPQSVQDNNKKLYATAVEQLKFNPNGIAYWLQLAQLRKGADDFTGAEEVWLYVTKRWPNDPIAFASLADVYAFSLKNSTKAVQYWNLAIAADGRIVSNYIALANFQHINLKDKVAAKATLEAGLKVNQGDTNLQAALAQLQ